MPWLQYFLLHLMLYGTSLLHLDEFQEKRDEVSYKGAEKKSEPVPKKKKGLFGFFGKK